MENNINCTDKLRCFSEIECMGFALNHLSDALEITCEFSGGFDNRDKLVTAQDYICKAIAYINDYRRVL